MDYRNYHLNQKEIFRYGAEALGLTGVIALCFYDSVWALGGYPLVLLWYLKEKKRVLTERRRKELQLGFRDGVQALATALAAGYSAENALGEAKKDLQLQGNKNSYMIQELAVMMRKLDANQTIEEAMRDFAERSGLEVALIFAEVFSVGKRNGGDLIEIMKDTAGTISETIETERQVAAVLASRKYEQKIMNGMPVAILLYLRIGCPGFLDPLYHNLPGVCVATGCLSMYVLAWYLGQKMLNIEV